MAIWESVALGVRRHSSNGHSEVDTGSQSLGNIRNVCKRKKNIFDLSDLLQLVKNL